MSFTLTDEQTRAIFEIRTWYADRMQPFWRLKGFAGTGKTSIMKFLMTCDEFQSNKQIAVVAFTHKAASVLRKKGIPEAKTIHSLAYKAEELPNGDYIFIKRSPDEIRSLYSLIIIDEASMVSKAMRDDLLSFGVPILFVGDSGQLPPISNDPSDKNGKFMMDAESELTEVHRQAADSPIIRLSMDIRLGKRIPFGKYGKGVWVVEEDDLDDDLLLKTDQMIVGKNETRKYYNRLIRKLKGFKPGNMPGIGEPVMILENYRELGLFNGLVIESSEDNNHMSLADCVGVTHSFRREIDLGGQQLDIEKMTAASIDNWRPVIVKPYFDGSKEFETTNEERYFMKRQSLVKMDFAYAITCHKSQGSSYRKPIVIEEKFGDREFHKRWLYTAVTRAEEKLILARNT